ncbi:Zinc-finger homeodomain protein [Melia azedarach]|uniref:Zinc-finger homeodomain protein n=1 Tax=Melia azedarach TaxID=155640 RepID=A0ACC1XSE5_MELAZ|nr:Zinc-finger homeodomain protein [Melia azedarach]
MTGSLGYTRDSSSKVSSTPINSALGETGRDQNTVHVDDETIFDPSETLDQQLLFHHQLNQDHNKPSGNRDINPDPVQAPTRATGTQQQQQQQQQAAGNINRSNQRSSGAALRQALPPSPTISPPLSRYKECQRNHAANMGSHVVDGCGEFMPSGEEGTSDALKCAACDCHRNFHRKETDGEPHYAPPNCHYIYNNPNTQRNAVPPQHHHHHPQQQLQHQHPYPPHYHQLLHPQQPPPAAPPPPHHHHHHHRIPYNSPPTAAIAPMMMTFGGGGSSGGLDESSSEDLNMYQSSARGQTSAQPRLSKKRFRTKFTQEQKDRMLEFAEKLGWRIQRQDEPEVLEFCNQIGVKRQVFKVWMHNNKQSSKKKEASVRID